MSGRLQLYDLGRPIKAHDVRNLRPCGACENIGFRPQMLAVHGKHYHGGCVVRTMTPEQILALPGTETAKLRLNETGRDLMMKLLEQADARPQGEQHNG